MDEQRRSNGGYRRAGNQGRASVVQVRPNPSAHNRGRGKGRGRARTLPAWITNTGLPFDTMDGSGSAPSSAPVQPPPAAAAVLYVSSQPGPYVGTLNSDGIPARGREEPGFDQHGWPPLQLKLPPTTKTTASCLLPILVLRDMMNGPRKEAVEKGGQDQWIVTILLNAQYGHNAISETDGMKLNKLYVASLNLPHCIYVQIYRRT